MERKDIFKSWFDQECFANRAMIKMIASVPQTARTDERYQRALDLAGHIAACRLNWLDRMESDGMQQGNWWPHVASVEELPVEFARTESVWREYLAQLEDDMLDVDFEFPVQNSAKYRWNILGQIMQLVGHAFYHRGQIALLVTELGGELIDTDYLYWAFEQQPDRWKLIP